MKTSEVLFIVEQNYEYYKEIYLTKGRGAFSESVGCNYNSAGHALKELGWYTKDLQKVKKDNYRNREKCKNPFLVENDVSAYLLGFILGDGSLQTKNEYQNHRVDIYNNDHDLMKQINYLFYDEDKLKVRHYENSPDGYALDMYDESLYWTLINLGLRENKSRLGCDLPVVSDEFFWSMMRGLLDSDGSVKLNRGRKGLDHRNSVSWYGHTQYIRQIKDRSEVELSYHERPEGLAYVEVIRKSLVTEVYHKMYDNAQIYMKRKRDKFYEGVLFGEQH